MNIKKINNKDEWNSFIRNNGEYSSFLQSWQWGEFQEKLGRKIWRLGIEENNKLTAVALIIKNNLPLGKSYLYLPRGPLVISNFQFPISNFIKIIIDYINDKSIIFLRADLLNRSQNSGLKTQVSNPVQPEHTLILDLNKSEEELLESMHHKTRYNIRLAKRKGVKVRFGKSDKDLDNFWRLIQETIRRDEFRAHGKDYYREMLNIDNVYLALAEYDGEVLVANIIMFYGKTATYLHGASSNKDRNVMAPYLLQWEAIKKAKNDGFKYYDFWGIAPEGSPKEKIWAGITRFKRGFGGQEVKYPGTYDFIINSFWYKLYCLVRKFR